jgi:hypothetical protein
MEQAPQKAFNVVYHNAGNLNFCGVGTMMFIGSWEIA